MHKIDFSIFQIRLCFIKQSVNNWFRIGKAIKIVDGFYRYNTYSTPHKSNAQLFPQFIRSAKAACNIGGFFYDQVFQE
jgi:hypothetical protein